MRKIAVLCANITTRFSMGGGLGRSLVLLGDQQTSVPGIVLTTYVTFLHQHSYLPTKLSLPYETFYTSVANFKCPICCETLRQPIELVTCGYYYCVCRMSVWMVTVSR